MNWSEALFAIFATVCTMILIIIFIIVHYLKKGAKFVTRPVTSRSRTSRK